MIDVGGPAMLRAAAKNFAHVAPCAGRTSTTRARRAARARELATTPGGAWPRRRSPRRPPYEAAIARWFGEREPFPAHAHARLREGHGRRVRREPAPACGVLRRARRPPARALDGRAARRQRALLQQPQRPLGRAAAVREFAVPACVDRQAREPVRRRARRARAEEAYDGRARLRPGLGLRRRRRAQPSGRLGARRAARGAVRRGAARARLRRRRARRLARSRAPASSPTASAAATTGASATTSASSAACSSRIPTAEVEDREGMEVVCRRARARPQWGDLVFAWRVCKHVASNAIVLAKDLRTIGIGAGQMSRVDAVRIAVEKAPELGHDPPAPRSPRDAFFPFRTVPDSLSTPGRPRSSSPAAHAATRTSSPRSRGGRDMVFTGRRHFRH